MIQKIKNYVLLITAALTLAAPALVPLAVASADPPCNGIASSVRDGANAAAGPNSNISCQPTSNSAQGTIGDIAAKVVSIFSIIVGAAAVIMIIYAGFRYITSGGSSDKVGNAKNSLIYAVIGLVIVAVAQLIVHFVLNQANSIGS